MISASAAGIWVVTARQRSSVELTSVIKAPTGGCRLVGPLMSTTSAPRANAAAAKA